ncbi:hypothetical protein KM043_003514 [Ampulex compressa]|nr:hypothetical protein KM043_003514 [Ampulex compressa]
MKLGDNMGMEACNIWGEIAPRKCRPPRIGDIPKHGAVDQESPGSSSKKLTIPPAESSPAELSPEPRRILLPASSASTILHSVPRLEPNRTSPKDAPRCSDKDLQSPSAADRFRFDATSQDFLAARRGSLKSQSGGGSEKIEEIGETKLRLSSKRDRSCAEELQEDSRIPSSPEDISDSEILEVRKDSALFLEEAEGLPTLREILRSRAPRIIRPRRESSGYASNLGTFDEDRRNSASIDVLQDLSSFLKERRRSSTKRLNSRMAVGRTEENVGEESSNACQDRMPTTEVFRKVSSAGLEMPNIEEVKEVPREEASSRQESLENLRVLVERASSDDSLRCDLAGQSSSPISSSEISSGRCLRIHQESSKDSFETFALNEAINRVSLRQSTDDGRTSHRSNSNKQSKPDVLQRPRTDDKFEDREVSPETRGKDEKPIFDLKKNQTDKSSSKKVNVQEVLPRILGDTSSSTNFIRKEERDLPEMLRPRSNEGTRDSESSFDIRRGFEESRSTASKSDEDKLLARKLKTQATKSENEETIQQLNVSLSKIILDPENTPVLLEEPRSHERREENREAPKETLPEPTKSDSTKLLSRRTTTHQCAKPEDTFHKPLSPSKMNFNLEHKPVFIQEPRPYETHEQHRDRLKDRDNPEEARLEPRRSDTGKLLPRKVKVYQLLSTRSEDQGDGEPNLADRRISLQISRHEEEVSTSEFQEEQADRGPVAACQVEPRPGVESPIRKLSSPVEATGQRFLGDAANVTVRPIYPYCPYSPYGSPQGSPRNRRRPLRESRRVSIDNRQGALQLNQYKLLDNIGQGSYGIVKLAYNEEEEVHYAMKILSKKKLMKKAGIFGRMAPGRRGAADPLAKVYREIALLKKLDHPNVVKLVEVLDDPDEDNLYLVFELVQRGEVLQIPTDKPLDEEIARKNFRDVVMGVEYLHYQRIVHRDIKPSNLLVDSDGRVKIADLGVSAELRASGELLSGPAGTPAFAAPETTTPGAHYSGTPCDVWSMGVTLYSLVTGRLPWDGAGSIIGVQAAVRSEPLRFPEKPSLSMELRDVISRMLAKDPAERICLQELKVHGWLTKGGAQPLPTEADNCRLPITVTDEEVERVVTRVPKLDTLILIKTMLKQHSFQNPFLPKRSGRVTCNEALAGGLEISEAKKGGESTVQREAVRNVKSERFQRTGRSNSAPDSYDWQTNGRQISVESPLPPVTEASSQELEVERR